jgi:hypothetical protein
MWDFFIIALLPVLGLAKVTVLGQLSLGSYLTLMDVYNYSVIYRENFNIYGQAKQVDKISTNSTSKSEGDHIKDYCSNNRNEIIWSI